MSESTDVSISTLSPPLGWYICQDASGQCQIRPDSGGDPPPTPHWGPFAERSEAVAKRVGLIRAGKCRPT